MPVSLRKRKYPPSLFAPLHRQSSLTSSFSTPPEPVSSRVHSTRLSLLIGPLTRRLFLTASFLLSTFVPLASNVVKVATDTISSDAKPADFVELRQSSRLRRKPRFADEVSDPHDSNISCLPASSTPKSLDELPESVTTPRYNIRRNVIHKYIRTPTQIQPASVDLSVHHQLDLTEISDIASLLLQSLAAEDSHLLADSCSDSSMSDHCWSSSSMPPVLSSPVSLLSRAHALLSDGEGGDLDLDVDVDLCDASFSSTSTPNRGDRLVVDDDNILLHFHTLPVRPPTPELPLPLSLPLSLPLPLASAAFDLLCPASGVSFLDPAHAFAIPRHAFGAAETLSLSLPTSPKSLASVAALPLFSLANPFASLAATASSLPTSPLLQGGSATATFMSSLPALTLI